MTSHAPHVVEADDGNFDRLAIEASHERPVVVDFWAEWCGPCRQLGPLLERLAAEFAGAFTLVKVDTETARQTAQAWNIRSIPAVVGIREGRVVAEFVGAQPEGPVREFLAKLLPSPADEQHRAGLEAARAGDGEAAEAAFRAALELEAGHPEASLALGHLLLTREAFDDARAIADQAQRGTAFDGELDRLVSALDIRTRGGGDIDALRAQVDATPDDPAARLELARAHAASGQHRDALDHYLESVRLDATYDDAAARRGMLDLFEVLGSDHEITREFRARLARLLYR